MAQNALDVTALIPGANLRYLTGGVHYVMERPIVWLLPLEGQPLAVIPKLEVPLFERYDVEEAVQSTLSRRVDLP